MANANPYQYALRQAVENGQGDSMTLLRRAVEDLCVALREEGVPPETATASLVRTASDLLLPDVVAAATHDFAQQIIDDIERWCTAAGRATPG